MRVELDESACAMAATPVSPMWLEDRFNSVRIELDESACAMDAAVVSLIWLKDRFDARREESLQARRRSWSEKEESKLFFVIICSRVELELEEEAMFDVYINWEEGMGAVSKFG